MFSVRRQAAIALMYAFLVALPGNAASGGPDHSSGSSSVQPSHQAGSEVIVIGFLGGFVPHDEPHHPEVQVIRGLRQEYLNDAYFDLFENRKVGEAYKAILKRLGASGGAASPADHKRPACIVLFGHSWGASAVVALSRKLERANIRVALTIQIDSVEKPFQNDWLIPPNVVQAVNYYQTHGLIHGRRRILAADPAHTTILGNFLWQYKGDPAECHGFSWRGRLLSRGHTQIECDSDMWLQVETLVRDHLPDPVRREPLPSARTEMLSSETSRAQVFAAAVRGGK
jgi:hypothetical protein